MAIYFENLAFVRITQTCSNLRNRLLFETGRSQERTLWNVHFDQDLNVKVQVMCWGFYVFDDIVEYYSLQMPQKDTEPQNIWSIDLSCMRL